jgi:hypothetical protein
VKTPRRQWYLICVFLAGLLVVAFAQTDSVAATRFYIASQMFESLFKPFNLCPGEIKARFSDVPKGDPLASAISAVSECSVMLGYPDGTFRGKQAVTRYESAAMLSRLLDLIKSKNRWIPPTKFVSPGLTEIKDVPQGHWALDSIHTLLDIQVISLYSDGTFRGQRAVSQKEIDASISLMKAQVSGGEATKPGRIVITSTPTGATVLQNDAVLGQTPLSRTFAPGPLNLTITKDGYAPRQVSINVEAGSNLTVPVTLEKTAASPVDALAPNIVNTDYSKIIQSRTFAEHGDAAFGVAYGPNGNLLAVASKDSKVRLWDLSAKRLQVLSGHLNWVTSVAFNHDGNFIVSASKDATAIVWNSKTGKALRVLKGHTEWINTAEFSPDGSLIVTASDDGTARIWNNSNTTSRPRILQENSEVTAAVFSPDGKQIVTALKDGTAHVWDLKGNSIRTFQHQGSVRGVRFSPDGELIATAAFDSTIRVWNALTGSLVLTLEGHSKFVTTVEFSPDGSLIASATSDGYFQLWHARTGKNLLTKRLHNDWLNSIAFNPNGKQFATASNDDTVSVWGFQDGGAISGPSRAWLTQFAPNAHASTTPDAPTPSQPPVAPGTPSARPIVAITTPSGLVSSTDFALQLKVGPSELDIARMTYVVSINGKDLPSTHVTIQTVGVTGSGTVSLVVRLPRDLPERDFFTLGVLAVSANNTFSVQDEKRFFYQPTANSKRTLFVLAVGVNTYAGGYRKLNFAIKDAKDFAKVFESQKGRGFDEVSTKVLADPTLEDVVNELDDLSNRVLPNDRVILFFSGHGINQRSLGADRYFAIMKDTKPERLAATGLSHLVLKEFVQRSQGQTFLFLDTCRSGAAFASSSKGDVSTNTKGAADDLNATRGPSNLQPLVFSAATGDTDSFEKADWGNGAFTKALLEALQEQKAANADGVVTLFDLFKVVADRVTFWTNGTQLPSVAWNGPNESFFRTR